jgi:hypothetical protein
MRKLAFNEIFTRFATIAVVAYVAALVIDTTQHLAAIA